MKRSPLATAIKLATTGVLAGALVACGGSGGGTTPSTATTGSSVGPVTGFGSVFVNGKRFNTDNASVTSDDGIGSEKELEKGMIVKVDGSWDDSNGEGEAAEIEYDDTLRGPVESANSSWNPETNSGELIVAGQRVLLDGQTVFRGATPEELTDPNGNYRVRVSAWPLADGGFRASFVGAGTGGLGSIPSDDLSNEVEVKGVVENHNVNGPQTFTISGLQVNYGSAIVDDDFQIDDGVGVEVEGSLNDSGELDATEIDDEDDFFSGLTGTVEFQGAIENAFDDTTQQFVLNGVTVQVETGTELKDGLLNADELIAGLQVKVEGSFNSDNVLVAREIELKEGDAEVEARIESIDRENETMVVGGVNVALTASTLIEIENASGQRNRDADLLALNSEDEGVQGDYVEVEGRFRNGVLEAVSIEREEDADADEEFELDGKLTAINGEFITVLGLEILAQDCNNGGVSQFLNKAVEVDYVLSTGTSDSYEVAQIKEDFQDDSLNTGPIVSCSADNRSDDSSSN